MMIPMIIVIRLTAALIVREFVAKEPTSVDRVHADHHPVSFSVKTVNHQS